MHRREFIFGLLGGASLLLPAWAHGAEPAMPADWTTAMADIERRVQGRLGVALLDTGNGRQLGWRQDERFPMASTFKLLLAAWMLKRLDQGKDSLDARVRYDASALLSYSPATRPHAGAAGMTIAELCEGAVILSDNTAANLLLARDGGPAGFTAFVRSLGDTITRLDRNEPTLNEGLPGDPRDTTSPRAMLRSMRAVLLGDALSAASRAQLLAWIVATKTGDKRLRAGVPGWRVGDKTGTGERGMSNDIGILWPPGDRAPVLVTCYTAQSTASADMRDAAIADVARTVARHIIG